MKDSWIKDVFAFLLKDFRILFKVIKTFNCHDFTCHSGICKHKKYGKNSKNVNQGFQKFFKMLCPKDW